MAPEQIEGQEADSHGSLRVRVRAYEMLTGRTAFEGQTHASLIAAIMHVEPPLVSKTEPSTPRALDRVVKKCLAKQADDRWQSARDLRDELQWIAEREAHDMSAPVSSTPVAQSGGWRRAVPWTIGRDHRRGIGVGGAPVGAVASRVANRAAAPQRGVGRGGLPAEFSPGSRRDSLPRRRGRRVRCAERRRWQSTDLRAATQPTTGHTVIRDRRCPESVFFARRTVGRVFRRQQAEEDRRNGWSGLHDMRRAERPRRLVGGRRHHRVVAQQRHSGYDLGAGIVRRRDTRTGDDTCRRRGHSSVAPASTGRNGRALYEQ